MWGKASHLPDPERRVELTIGVSFFFTFYVSFSLHISVQRVNAFKVNYLSYFVMYIDRPRTKINTLPCFSGLVPLMLIRYAIYRSVRSHLAVYFKFAFHVG